MVDRNEHLHSLVAAPLPELSSAKDTTIDGSLARHFDRPSSGTGNRDEGGLFRAAARHALG